MMTEFLVGAHLDNVDEPSDDSYRRLTMMRAQIVGTMWTDGTRHRRRVYERLEATLNKPVYSIRVGPSARVSAGEWRRQASAALLEVPLAIVESGRVRFRALNEPNLPAEGAWEPWEYAGFLAEVRSLTRALHGRVSLVCAPISLGPPDWREWWEEFVAACHGVIPADRLAVNCYAQSVGFAALFAAYGLPVDVTEINTLDIPPGPARAAWLLGTCRGLAAAGIESAQVFIIGGKSYGAWDERYILTDDEAAELGRRQPIGEASVKAKTPWDGKGCLIWNLPSDLGPVVELGQELQLDFWDVKVANGAASWAGTRVTPNQIKALRAGGRFRVTGWAYDYADLAGIRFTSGDGIPEIEARTLAEAIQTLGLDGATVDLEIEVEGHADLVAIELDTLRTLLRSDFPLAAHTWATLEGHTAYPFDVIADRMQVIRPMCYRPVWNAADMWRSLGPHLAGHLVAPVWGLTLGSLEQLRDDDAVGPPIGTEIIIGESYWELGALMFRRGELGALIRSRFPSAPPQPAVPDLVTSALDGLWADTERDAAEGYVARALENQSRIVTLKTALGR